MTEKAAYKAKRTDVAARPRMLQVTVWWCNRCGSICSTDKQADEHARVCHGK